jgi:hypothetical protein
MEDREKTRSVRTLVFESADDATAGRAREILSNGSGFEEIVTLETSDRVVMVDYRS